MLAAVKSQVLGEGQSDPRGEKTLDARSVGKGEEHGGPCEGPGIPEVALEELSHIMLHAHGGEDNGELDLLFQ